MSDDVSDPTDWAATSLPFLAQFDAGLRCQVCKDYFTSAVMTSCSHTFCSLCIRRCLAAEGRCPTCRANEQETRLRRNVAVQELADLFVAARPDALSKARAMSTATTHPEPAQEGRERKRKRDDGRTANGTGSPPSRRRSQRLQSNGQSSPPGREVISLDDDIQEHTQHHQPDGDYEPDDGLVACPICHKRMKAEAVFGHLDRCENESTNNHHAKRTSHPPSRSNTTTPLPAPFEPIPAKPPPERLPQINYSLLKDNALRRKLSELNITSSGARVLLIRRHTEWLNLWNANCDSARPRTRKELLGDLDAWERSQGAFSANGGQPQPAAVMRKNFDGAAWAKKNKDDFSSLIASARRKREHPVAAPAPASSGIAAAQDATLHPPPPHLTATSTTVPTSSTSSAPPPTASTTSRRGSLPSSTTSHRDSLPYPANDPPSIFSAPHPALETQTSRRSSGTRSPVPGFCFEKSVQFGGREPPPRLLSASSGGSGGGSPVGAASGRRGSRTEAHADGLKEDLAEERPRSSVVQGVRKMPMFRVPADPVMDAEMGGMK